MLYIRYCGSINVIYFLVNNQVMENDILNNLNFNSLNESDDSGIIILFVIFFFSILVLSIIGIFVINKRRRDEDASSTISPSPTSDVHGSRDPAVQQILAQVPPEPPSGFSMPDFLQMLGPLLLGIGIGAAMDAVFWALKRLEAGSRNVIKSAIRASAAFKSALRPKFNIRAAMKSGRKFLAKNLMKLSMSSRVLFGMLWSKALRAAGVSATQVESLLAARIGQAAAERVAARTAAQVATKTAGMGPFAAAELAVGVVGMALDMTNTGGYTTIDSRKTSDLLVEREKQNATLKNAFIQGPKKDDGTIDASAAAGFYPLYWGPLDEMNDVPDVDGLDAFDMLIEERMFTLLFAEDPDPFITKLFVHMAQRYGTSTTDLEENIRLSMVSDMDQDDYWGLYDRAFNSLCTENGGVLIDPGVAGVPLQCSHASETACHAKSPYTAANGPSTNDDTNYTYTEWRDRDFFNKNYGPAQVPSTASGACIIQSPAIPDACMEQVCTTRSTGTKCGQNEYIRNRGICQNTEDLCRNTTGVSYCERMPKPGEAGQECETGLGLVRNRADLGPASSILLPNETLKSCYTDPSQNWGEFFLGETIFRYFESGAFTADAATLGQATAQGLATAATSVAVQAAGVQGSTVQAAFSADAVNWPDYSGPGSVPSVKCNNFPGVDIVDVGSCRQVCPDDRVAIDVGAGKYCYKWCPPGTERGTDLSTVDSCSTGTGCYQSKACPYTNRDSADLTRHFYTYTEGKDQDGQTISYKTKWDSLTREQCEEKCDTISECNGIITRAQGSGTGTCWAVRGLPSTYNRGGSAVATRGGNKIKCPSGYTLYDNTTCCPDGTYQQTDKSTCGPYATSQLAAELNALQQQHPTGTCSIQ